MTHKNGERQGARGAWWSPKSFGKHGEFDVPVRLNFNARPLLLVVTMNGRCSVYECGYALNASDAFELVYCIYLCALIVLVDFGISNSRYFVYNFSVSS